MTSHHARQLVVAVIVLGLVALSTPIYAQDDADFWEAVARGDLNTLQRALESGLDPDVRESNGSTPLIVAAMFGQTDLVRLPIENTAALDVQNNDEATALFAPPCSGTPTRSSCCWRGTPLVSVGAQGWPPSGRAWSNMRSKT